MEEVSTQFFQHLFKPLVFTVAGYLARCWWDSSNRRRFLMLKSLKAWTPTLPTSNCGMHTRLSGTPHKQSNQLGKWEDRPVLTFCCQGLQKHLYINNFSSKCLCPQSARRSFENARILSTCSHYSSFSLPLPHTVIPIVCSPLGFRKLSSVWEHLLPPSVQKTLARWRNQEENEEQRSWPTNLLTY